MVRLLATAWTRGRGLAVPLVAGALLAGCGGSSTVGTSVVTPGPDACTLLSAEEIVAASTLAVGAPIHPNSGNRRNMDCRWNAGTSPDSSDRYVELTLDPGATQYPLAIGSPVPGLGQEARVEFTNYTLDVKVSSSLAFSLIVVDDGQQYPALTAEEIALAKLVVPRLGK